MASPSSVYAVVLAAGNGARFGDRSCPKQYRLLAGRSVLSYAVEAFGRLRIPVLAVGQKTDGAALEKSLKEVPDRTETSFILRESGSRRQSSFYALEALREKGIPPQTSLIIHDGARPFLSRNVIQRGLAALQEGFSGAMAAVALTDSLTSLQEDGSHRPVDRGGMYRLQAPEFFRMEALWAAHQRAKNQKVSPKMREAFCGTNFSLLEAAGYRTKLVLGDRNNIKLTVAEDLVWMNEHFSVIYPSL